MRRLADKIDTVECTVPVEGIDAAPSIEIVVDVVNPVDAAGEFVESTVVISRLKFLLVWNKHN